MFRICFITKLKELKTFVEFDFCWSFFVPCFIFMVILFGSLRKMRHFESKTGVARLCTNCLSLPKLFVDVLTTLCTTICHSPSQSSDSSNTAGRFSCRVSFLRDDHCYFLWRGYYVIMRHIWFVVFTPSLG